MRIFLKKSGVVLAVLSVLFIIFYFYTWYGFNEEREDISFGVTFSTVMARQLGLEPREVFDAMADDLGVKRIRIPVYWTEIEAKEGKFDFSGYDYFVKKSEDKDIKLIFVVGRKLPRWPECFIPAWATGLGHPQRQEAINNMIRTVVSRYVASSAVEAWQVENEPFFAFGKECAEDALNSQELEEEIKAVRQLSSKPVIISDSGEQGFWVGSARRGDVLGITMYRQSWSDFLGVSHFPFGPGFYRMKAKFLAKNPVVVVELQAEPWGKELLPLDSLDFQKELMNAEQLRSNISYARRSGFDTFYLWGVEWWWWIKEKQSDDSLWEEARALFKL